MRTSSLERRLRRAALAGLALATSALLGVGLAEWAIADTNGFYTHPVDRGAPAYGRDRPVADDLWERQAAGTVSTAISVQPEYRSASGS